MKKTLFAGLLLLLVVSLIGIISCTKSAATSTSTARPQPGETTTSFTTGSSPSQALSSTAQTANNISTAGSLTNSESTGFDWSTIPVYPGSVRATALEDAMRSHDPTLGNFRVYTTDIANANKVLDYYNSELSKNGWNILVYGAGLSLLQATNGPNTVIISVNIDQTDQSKCDVIFSIQPS